MATSKKQGSDLDPVTRVEVVGVGNVPIQVEIANPQQSGITIDEVKNLVEAGIPVELQSPDADVSSDLRKTWKEIEKTRINFSDFIDDIDAIINGNDSSGPLDLGPVSLLHNSHAYNLVKFAVNYYVRTMLGIPGTGTTLPPSTNPGVLPYYELVLQQLNEVTSARIAARSVTGNPAFQTNLRANRAELIWSYWMEEGMLVQSMNAIALRFQNISNGVTDPLANLEIDSLRPLANVLFGYINDSVHRLSVTRRNYEYQYEYGIKLFGKAIQHSIPVTTRAGFIQAFHNLLFKATEFYKLLDDRTMNADAFPLLNSLQEVNLLLTEGMHNQYNELSLTAKAEMMLEQWILSRKEIQEFLRGKAMVLYKEKWMGAVDSMKQLQGWPLTSIRFYYDLANNGEDLLLSIRLIPWNTIGTATDAKAWAVDNREIIQRYIHNYQAVTGVDLAADPNTDAARAKYLMPGILLQQKFQQQRILKRG